MNSQHSPGDTDLVSVEDVKKKWKADNEEASPFQIDSIANMVEQEKNGMTLKGFALGCLLFAEARSRSVLPKSCSVKEYIATGFRGSSTLSMWCESQQRKRSAIRLWVFLLISNLILSVASVAYWATWPLGFLTFMISIYSHWFWHSVLFTWRNEHLTGSTLSFSIIGCLDLSIGFLMAMLWSDQDELWFWLWYCWCLMQVIYMVPSTIYLVNVLRLLRNMSHDTIVPVPQYTVFTSHMCAAWGLLLVYTAIFAILTIVGIVFNDIHLAQFMGILASVCGFILPALGVLIAMVAKGYPKRLLAGGFVCAAVLAVASITAVIAFYHTGRLMPWEE